MTLRDFLNIYTGYIMLIFVCNENVISRVEHLTEEIKDYQIIYIRDNKPQIGVNIDVVKG